MTSSNIINDIFTKRSLPKISRSARPYANFHYRYDSANQVYYKIREVFKRDRQCLNEARAQYVISCISNLEVYFKDLFVAIFKLCKGEQILPKCENILKDKFDFKDIVNIYLHNISFEEIVTSSINFQNLGNVDRTFSALLNRDFFNTLKDKTFKSNSKGAIPFKLSSDFYQKIEEFIELRHQLVHDVNIIETYSDKKIELLSNNLSLFVVAVDILIHRELIEPNLRKEFI